MTVHEFARKRPRLFHLSAGGAWSGLTQHGILTTASLLKMTNLDSEQKRREVAHRRRSGNVTLEVPGLGRVILRDQVPLNSEGLRKALPDGYEPQRWIDLLNERVFLWTRVKDCLKLMDAKLCRGSGALLVLDSSSFLAAYEEDVEFTTFNVGYTLRKPKARSPASFIPFASYPSGRLGQIRELTVKKSVKDLASYLVDRYEWNEAETTAYQQMRDELVPYE